MQLFFYATFLIWFDLIWFIDKIWGNMMIIFDDDIIKEWWNLYYYLRDTLLGCREVVWRLMWWYAWWLTTNNARQFTLRFELSWTVWYWRREQMFDTSVHPTRRYVCPHWVMHPRLRSMPWFDSTGVIEWLNDWMIECLIWLRCENII